MKNIKTILFLFLVFTLNIVTVIAQPEYDVQPIKSSTLENKVIIDGEVTYPEEWEETTPVDFLLGDQRSTVEPFYATRIWAKNDCQCLYMLFRIEFPSGLFDPADDCFIAYYYNGYDPIEGWGDADFAFTRVNSETADWYGFDETQWYVDEDAGGENNVQGMGSHDGTYYWFELVKELDSMDGFDWVMDPGKTYGSLDLSSDHLEIGLFDDSEVNGYNHYISLKIAPCTSPVGGELLSYSANIRIGIILLAMLASSIIIVKKHRKYNYIF
jgi:hypothetical protein